MVIGWWTSKLLENLSTWTSAKYISGDKEVAAGHPSIMRTIERSLEHKVHPRNSNWFPSQKTTIFTKGGKERAKSRCWRDEMNWSPQKWWSWSWCPVAFWQERRERERKWVMKEWAVQTELWSGVKKLVHKQHYKVCFLESKIGFFINIRIYLSLLRGHNTA